MGDRRAIPFGPLGTADDIPASVFDQPKGRSFNSDRASRMLGVVIADFEGDGPGGDPLNGRIML